MSSEVSAAITRSIAASGSLAPVRSATGISQGHDGRTAWTSSPPSSTIAVRRALCRATTSVMAAASALASSAPRIRKMAGTFSVPEPPRTAFLT